MYIAKMRLLMSNKTMAMALHLNIAMSSFCYAFLIPLLALHTRAILFSTVGKSVFFTSALKGSQEKFRPCVHGSCSQGL